MKTLEEILLEYKIPEETPLLIIQGNTDMDVTWRYLKGGWDEVLNSKVINFGRDVNIGRIVFELESA